MKNLLTTIFWIFLGIFLSLFIVSVNKVDSNPKPLNISTFRDISSFILETAKNEYQLNIEIKYVKNADEAHLDLKDHKADIVFMSYDDTLSIALEDKYTDIAAFIPIHGGIIDLCGELDLIQSNRVGIDTNTGYARALRFYLHKRFPNPDDYNRLIWIKAGATDIRYAKLLNHQIDATLLNPPFSYMPNINRIVSLSDVIGPYQGVVGNINKSWLQNSDNKQNLDNFVRIYQKTINNMRQNPEQTITKLQEFYKISPEIAANVYKRLWQSDGLNTTGLFNNDSLLGTEKLFTDDTNIKVPESRTWIK